jgi:hypothetical protein
MGVNISKESLKYECHYPWGIYYDKNAQFPLMFMNEQDVWGICKHVMFTYVNNATCKQYKNKQDKNILYLIWRTKYVYVSVEKYSLNKILFTFLNSETEFLFLNAIEKTLRRTKTESLQFYKKWQPCLYKIEFRDKAYHKNSYKNNCILEFKKY